jgi:hypothetical protein
MLLFAAIGAQTLYAAPSHLVCITNRAILYAVPMQTPPVDRDSAIKPAKAGASAGKAKPKGAGRAQAKGKGA